MCAATGVVLILKGQVNRRIRERLQDAITLGDGDVATQAVILRDFELSTVPFINDLLKHAAWARKLDTLLVQADMRIRLGSFVLLIIFIGFLVAFATAFVLHQPLFALPAGLLAAPAPIFYARHRKMRRVRQFERQFPDALDMLSGALRAGLAFTGAIQVVADESPDPVAKEFRVLFEENRLGLDMKEGLKKLAARIDSTELRLFVTAVILQRETGGNLAEVLDGTAAVIRDRFRILGDVRSLTAQARLSGMVLMVLPLAMAGFISVAAPDYLKGLLADPLGRYLAVAAVTLQVVGFLIMRRIVNIKV